MVYRRKYVNTTRVQWTRVSQGNGVQRRSSWLGEPTGGWFVATMARLLCPGSIAPPPNHPSGLSHGTLMQVPATTGEEGRRWIDVATERKRKRGRRATKAVGGEIKIVSRCPVKMKVYSRDLLLSLCSTAPVHAYRANSILSTSRYGGKKLPEEAAERCTIDYDKLNINCTDDIRSPGV